MDEWGQANKKFLTHFGGMEGSGVSAQPKKRWETTPRTGWGEILMDRLPPSSLESEQATIGACLTDPQHCIPECQVVLTDFHFYDLRCRTVWETLCKMVPS